MLQMMNCLAESQPVEKEHLIMALEDDIALQQQI